ncbi:hypothetical protein AAFF_G00065010 [Aldrovandia affinis]|uniref:trypsin n=1 Tax=Aldrovandia affinis TaxID=143900 RepID=A0AAD7T3Z7_9TELE|nr:hypothetical protein AAFF_G00065010 [Aldrovandia affinis]
MPNLTPWVTMVILISTIPADMCVEIIGGVQVRNHSKPFMALVTGRDSLCGGALIKPDWVLTAAHCHREEMYVTLGAYSRSKKEKEQQKFTVTHVVPHSKFSNKTAVNDFMLLKMDKPAQLNQYVKTLDLPREVKDVKVDSECSVAGWGLTHPNTKEGSDKLMAVTVRVISRKKCTKDYKKNKLRITGDMLCAWDKNGERDTSKGDSGGPLVCEGKFVAVLSFGENRKPGVFSLLTKKTIKWIEKITGGNQ